MLSPTSRMVAVLATLLLLTRSQSPAVIGLVAVALGYQVLAYFRFGAAQAAFSALRQGDLARTKKLLDATSPRYLSPEARAFMHWTRAGLADAHRKADSKANTRLALVRDELDAAARYLPARHRQSGLLLVTLAAAEARLGHIAEAEKALQRARSANAPTAAMDRCESELTIARRRIATEKTSKLS